MIRTPAHGTYPSGHGCESRVMAEVLIALTAPAIATDASTALAQQLRALAKRIGDNRIVAGVHFPTDQDAGDFLGARIARYFVTTASLGKWTLVQTQGGNSEIEIFEPNPSQSGADGLQTEDSGEVQAAISLPVIEELKWHWTVARKEWAWLN